MSITASWRMSYMKSVALLIRPVGRGLLVIKKCEQNRT